MGTIGQLAEQARIGARIRLVCDQRFDGDPRRMAEACGASYHVLRDILRGRHVQEHLLETAVRRVCRLESVNGLWLRTGQGRAFTRPGDDEPAGSGSPSSLLTQPTPAANPEPQETAPVKPAENPTAPQLDLFGSLLQRVVDLEKQLAALRDAPPPPSARSIDELRDRISQVQAKTESRCKAAEDLALGIGATVEEQGRLLGRHEQALVGQANRLDEHDAALASLSADVSTLTAAAAIDREEAARQCRPSLLPLRVPDESTYGDEELFSVRDYLALPGDVPARLRDCGLPQKSFSNVLTDYELYQRLPEVFAESDERVHLFRAGSFRMLARYLASLESLPAKLIVRELFTFALAVDAPRPQTAEATG